MTTENPPGPAVRRPPFGENPDVDIVRLAAASSMQRLERERDAAITETRQLRELAERAWSVIANAGWEDRGKTVDWHEVAARWIDDYHAWLRAQNRAAGGLT